MFIIIFLITFASFLAGDVCRFVPTLLALISFVRHGLQIRASKVANPRQQSYKSAPAIASFLALRLTKLLIDK